MVRVSLLERCFSRTNVHFWCASTGCLDSCPIDYSAGKAYTFQRALVRFATITFFRQDAVRVLFASMNPGVMLLNNRTHVRHTTVADLNRISIENLMQLRAFRKVLINKAKEFPSNVSHYVLTVGRVKPCYSPLAVLFLPWPVHLPALNKLHSLTVAAGLKRFVI